MARYKHTDVTDGQGLFLPVNLKEQLLPGTFEYMLNDLIDNKIDIGIFDENYKNDKTGAKAVPPSALIKLIIYGYSKGKKSSRGLGELAQDNIIAKALTGNLEPHWTSIADFISSNSEKFQEVFSHVLAYCVELGLVGGDTFAVDGLRLPSNASMQMSGTKEELEKKLAVYQKTAEKHVAKHRKQDEGRENAQETERNYQKRQKHLNCQIEKISSFLRIMEQKKGKSSKEIKSNVTDNESAVLHSSAGYLQGYIGIAVSDKKNQIIVNAEAVGSANEGEYLSGMLDKTLENLDEVSVKMPEETKPVFMADANYFSEENLKACRERGVEAIIPDGHCNRRLGSNNERRYEAGDFKYRCEENYYECPNGKRLEYKWQKVLGGQEGKVYQASVKDCRLCPLNSRCIRTMKEISKWDKGRQLFITGSNEPGSLCGAMREKLSVEKYQDMYAYRIQIIEPVFANISYCKGLNRFTLRGKKKVNGQWKLYCMVHNLGKCLKGYNQEKKYG